MKKKFALNGLLKVRQQKMRIIQTELFQIEEQFNQLENEKARSNRELGEIEEEIRRTTKITERQQLDHCLQSAHFVLKEIQKKSDELEKKREKVQKVLSKALSERKIVESLKTRVHLSQLNQQEGEEIAFYDEMAQRTSTE